MARNTTATKYKASKKKEEEVNEEIPSVDTTQSDEVEIEENTPSPSSESFVGGIGNGNDEVLGIDQLVLLISVVASSGGTVAAILEDGKVNWSDTAHIFRLFGHLQDLKNIDFKKVLPEIKDLSTDEITRLGLVFDSKFDLVNDDIEKKVEEGLSEVRKFVESVMYFVKMRTKVKMF